MASYNCLIIVHIKANENRSTVVIYINSSSPSSRPTSPVGQTWGFGLYWQSGLHQVVDTTFWMAGPATGPYKTRKN